LFIISPLKVVEGLVHQGSFRVKVKPDLLDPPIDEHASVDEGHSKNDECEDARVEPEVEERILTNCWGVAWNV
jgi:hypothetical protein